MLAGVSAAPNNWLLVLLIVCAAATAGTGAGKNNLSPNVSGCWPVRSDLVYLLLAEEVAEYWLRDQIPRLQVPLYLVLRHFRELQDQ